MKNWRDVPRDLVALDAMEHCIRNNILTHDSRIQVQCITYGPDGTGYSGYRRVSYEEVVKRKAIVGFFEGFQVTWTDVIMYPYPVGLSGIELLTPEQLQATLKLFAQQRVFSGTLDEVKAYCS